jgi:CO/xanthine dehydrogenase FAD-binding subunit
VSHNQVTEYLRPRALEEALALLHNAGKSARLVGGGADVALSLGNEVSTLIDLCNLGLSTIEDTGDQIQIGATATLNQVLESADIKAMYGGVLSKMLQKVASPLLRNIGTIGGTLVSAHPWSDVIPLLEVLGAQVTLYDGQYQTYDISKLYESRAIFTGSIVTQVAIPKADGRDFAAFHKFSRTGYDVALLNVACYLHMGNDGCRKSRIAIGGTPHLASRVAKVEEALNKERLTPETIEQVALVARDTTKTANDRRATGEYRKQLVYAGVKQCLSEILDKSEDNK